MQYLSSEHKSGNVAFRQAVLRSLAPDGGLYIPADLPRLPQAVFKNISEMSLAEVSYFLFNALLSSDLPSAILKRIGEEALSFPIPLVKVEEGIYALELFHGPTHAVKDVSARALGRMLGALSLDGEKPITAILATNGNSGNAIAHGLYGIPGVNVLALFPKGLPQKRIAQLSSLGGNVHPVSVNGSIDQCRKMMGEAMRDDKFSQDIRLSIVNSINIGRVIPNIISYFWAYAQLLRQEPKPGQAWMAVPTGNGGNLIAGCYARMMGLPIERLIGACNANAGFDRLLRGEPMRQDTVKTIAFAMDTPQPANAPRFKALCGGDLARLRETVGSRACSDEEICQAIVDVYKRTGYLLEPHSATAYISLRQALPAGKTGIFMATSHPYRSAGLINQLLGLRLELPGAPKLSAAEANGSAMLPPTYPALRKFAISIDQ